MGGIKLWSAGALLGGLYVAWWGFKNWGRRQVTFFGTPVALNDPAIYLIAWVVVTAALVVAASAGYGELALGTAASVVLGVAIVTKGAGLPFSSQTNAGGNSNRRAS